MRRIARTFLIAARNTLTRVRHVSKTKRVEIVQTVAITTACVSLIIALTGWWGVVASSFLVLLITLPYDARRG